MTYWYAYGLTQSDYTIVAGDAEEGAPVPVMFQSGTLTAWNQKDAGAQLQLALDAEGETLVTSVTSSTGVDDYLPGTLTTFYAQVPSLWIDGDGGSGPRLFMQSREAADMVVALRGDVSNNLDAVTALNTLTAYMLGFVVWAGSWPLRPPVGARRVIWFGPTAPPATVGYAVEGDGWWK